MVSRKNGKPTEGRNAEGKFTSGNPGRPAGSRNKTTTAILSLLEGQGEALSQKAVEMALDGDTTALRLCIERIAPTRKDAPVQFDIPEMNGANDAAKAAGAVVAGVSKGELTPTEGTHVMALIDAYRRTLETTELERRISALEEARK